MANIRDLEINSVKKFVNDKNLLSDDQVYDKEFSMMMKKSTSYKNAPTNII